MSLHNLSLKKLSLWIIKFYVLALINFFFQKLSASLWLQIPEPLQDKFTMANMASACALVVSEEKSFDPVRSWTTKTAATTCAFVSVSVISICIMVVCGVFIVREYALSKSYKRFLSPNVLKMNC